MKRALLKAWEQGGALSHLLLPLAWLFGLLVVVRRHGYSRGWLKSIRLPVPVIVIGNITVGGAGKTPLTIELASRFKAAGRKVGVVSRGYGGMAHALPRAVDVREPASICGDEPLLIARRSACPVMVGRDRAAAAQALAASGCELILADDGLQHYALQRDIEIVVVDGRRRFGNRRLLPAGPLREPIARLAEADFVWVNGADPQTGEAGYRLHLGEALALTTGESTPLADFAGQTVHAVAGIGDPGRFFSALRQYGLIPIEHAFTDHHAFAADELNFDQDMPVFMTEKDAVKCTSFALAHWYAVPVSAELPQQLWHQLNDRLTQVKHG